MINSRVAKSRYFFSIFLSFFNRELHSALMLLPV